MSNTVLNATIIAKMAIRILENELVMASRVYRGYEDEFDKRVNGYKPGASITIKKPTDFTVRDGPTASIQDVTEGSLTFTVNKQKGIDFKFSSTELTLTVPEIADRVIKPAMVQLANQVDSDVMALYKDIPNWVGTPGQTINSYADFAKGPERLDLLAAPSDSRVAVLSPSDYWGMLGSQTALFFNSIGQPAYRNASLGMIGGVDTYMSQNIPTHTAGTRDDTTPITKVAGTGVLSTTYATSKDLGYMDLSTQGWDNGGTLVAGDVFTIADLYDVNPVTKATLPHLKMFTVVTAVAGNVTTTNETTVRISPPIIASGAFQNCSGPAIAAKAIVNIGTAATGYAQNLVFHKNAFGLCVVPMERPPGAVEVARESYKGLSVRVIPYYDGTNDVSNWRLDILYGVKTIDPRLAVRLSGTG